MKTEYPVEVLSEDEDNGTMVKNIAEFSKEVIGHRIVKVEKTGAPPHKKGEKWFWNSADSLRIILDNGKSVFLQNLYDCCAYTELESFLLNAEKIYHIITGVGTSDGYRTWHILADYGDVLEVHLKWSCGNPFYYAYGFEITVIDDNEGGTNE